MSFLSIELSIGTGVTKLCSFMYTIAKLFNIRIFTFVHSSEMEAHSARP